MYRHWNLPFKSRLTDYRMPDDFILKFTGTRHDNGGFQGRWLLDSENTFSLAKFFPYKGFEHMLFLGSDGNEIVTVNANGSYMSAKMYSPPAGVSHMITDVAFPANECKTVVIGCAEGILDSTDLTKNTRVRYTGGHTRTIRQVEMHKDDSNMVATCAKDGHIYVWDLRSQIPKLSIQNAHAPLGDKGVQDITSLRFVSDKIIVTGADCKSDLRFWDLRYQKNKKPMFRKGLPDGRVMAIETSRTGREIYAVMSTQEIYEYHYIDQKALSDHHDQHYLKPLRPYKDGLEQAAPSRRMKYYRPFPNHEYVTVARHSPISDHLLVGGFGAKVYDLHRDVPHFNDRSVADSIPLEPKFYFYNYENHLPTTVDWSVDGRLILTLTENELVIWDREWPQGEEYVALPVELDSDDVDCDGDAYITKLNSRTEPYMRVRINPRMARRASGYAKPLKMLYTESIDEPNVIEPIVPQVNLTTPKKVSYKRKCIDDSVVDKRACITPGKQNTPNRGQQTLDSFIRRDR